MGRGGRWKRKCGSASRRRISGLQSRFARNTPAKRLARRAEPAVVQGRRANATPRPGTSTGGSKKQNEAQRRPGLLGNEGVTAERATRGGSTVPANCLRNSSLTAGVVSR